MKTTHGKILLGRLFRLIIGASLVVGLLVSIPPFASTALAETPSGNALLFDGADDYVDIASGATLGTSFTQEAWIYPTYSDNNYHGFLGYQPGSDNQRPPSLYGYGLKIHFGFGDGTTWCNDTTGNVLTRNSWNHVAATFDGASYRIYVNGVQEYLSTACSGRSPYSSPQRYIGRMDTYFQGYIDEVRVWTVARTAADIRANMYKELGATGNLAAYYKLNESGSTATTVDSSGNGRNGTLTNFSFIPSPWRTSGAFAGPGNALEFDGSSEYVDIADGAILGASFTQEAWIYPSSGNITYRGFLGYDPGPDNQRSPSLYTHGNRIYYGFGNGIDWLADETGNVLTRHAWNHVAATFDGTTYRIYVNGVEVDTSTNASGETPCTTPVRRIGQGDISFKGRIDEVRIWTTVRTAEEIRDGMFRTLVGSDSGLAAYYRFDQSNASDQTTLYDMTNNARHGTLTNMEATSDWRSSGAFNTWIGGHDTAWSTADNWSRAAAPNACDNVGIYSYSGGNAPILSANTTFRNLDIASDATLTASGSPNMLVQNHWLAYGTFTPGSSTVSMTGNEPQHIAGSGTVTFNHLKAGGNYSQVAYWKLDEDSEESVFDAADDDNTGILNNYPTRSTDVASDFNYCNPGSLQFDGIDDYVSIPDHPDFNFGTEPFSIAFWFKKTGDSRGDLLSWKTDDGDDELSIFSREDEKVEFLLRLNGTDEVNLISGTTASLDTWHHVTIVRDGSGDITLYVNGVPDGTAGSSADLDEIDSTPIYLGSNRDDYGDPIDVLAGNLDDVRMYSTDLTLEEVQTLADKYDCSDSQVSLEVPIQAGGNLTVFDLDVSTGNYAVGVGGNWTRTSRGSFNERSGTVTFNGSSPQMIYNTNMFSNLMVNNSGSVVILADDQTITNNLGVTSGTLNLNTYTADRESPGGVLQVDDGGTLRIVGTHTLPGNYTSFNFSPASTVEYGGSSQTVSAQTYGHLTTSGSSTKTLDGETTVMGDLTIGSDTTFDVSGSSHALNVAGDWSKSGGFTARSGTVTFNGSEAQALSGETTFYNLTVDNSAGVSSNNNMTVNNTLTLISDLNTGTNRLEMGADATSSGDGDVVGTVRRTDLDATARSFGNPYVTISIDSGTAPNPMDVTLAKGSAPFTGAVKRRYTLIPTGGSGYSATLRLHYLDEELNENTEEDLQLWRYDTGISRWIQQPRTGLVDTTNNWLEKSGVSALDSNWAISEKGDPTAVTLTRFQALINGTGVRLEWETASEVGVVGYNLYRSQAIDGVYSQLNSEPVWAKGTGGLIGGIYTWEDINLQPGVTYYYKLEEVGPGGTEDLEIVSFTAPYQVYLTLIIRE